MPEKMKALSSNLVAWLLVATSTFTADEAKVQNAIDLSHWKLTLPVAASGAPKGNPLEISAARLSAGYTNAEVLETIFSAGSSTDGVTVVGDGFTVRSGKVEFQFSQLTGQLIHATVGGKTVPLSNGPRLVAESADQKTIPASGPTTVRTSNAGGNVVIQVEHSAGLSHFKWTVKPGGVLQLDYQGDLPAAKYHYAGIGFDLADRAVKSKRRLGGGPFRV
jgi:hypothetical protein